MNIESCFDILYEYVFRIWLIIIIKDVIMVIWIIICILEGIWLWISEINKFENVIMLVSVSDIIKVVFSLVVIVSVE